MKWNKVENQVELSPQEKQEAADLEMERYVWRQIDASRN